MNPSDFEDCESRLRELGADWSNDPEFARRVLEEIDEFTDTALIPSQGGNMLKMNLVGLAAAAAVVVAIFFFLPDSQPVSAKSLSAAIQKAIAEVKTIHIVNYGTDKKTGELKPGVDTWFVRGKGWARIGRRPADGFFQIDDGQYYWERNDWEQKGEGPVVVTRRKSRNRAAMFEKRTFPDSRYERLPDEDITIEGERLSCYSTKNLAPFAEGPQRVYTYVTSENRIYKSVTWMFKDDNWNLFSERRFHYNVDVDENVFKPKLGKNDKLIDLDAEFDQLTNLENSLFRQTVSGFDYAVHRVRALEGGGVMLFTSVRPSEARPKPGFSARIYDASPQYSKDFRIELGTTRHNDVSAQWFIRVPRDKRDNWDHITDGQLKLQETFNQRDESDNSIKGFAFKYVEIVVPVENWKEPISLQQAAKEVYADQEKLPNINLVWLDTGVQIQEGTPYGQRGSVSTVTSEEYAGLVVGHLDYWRGLDHAGEREAIEKAIQSGTVQISVPGLDVGGMAEFSDEDLVRAIKRPGLIAIYVSETSITDDGLKSLADSKTLERLVLRSTSISDAGLKHLHNIPTLKILDVRRTNVSKTGIDEIKKAIPALKVSSFLDDDDS